MDCNLTEKVSLLIDRALAAEEEERMRIHLAACAECQQVEQDFIRLRQQIKSYVPHTDPFAERQALWRILTSRKASLWRRKVALPAPVFAVMLVILLAFAAWSMFIRAPRNSPADQQARNDPSRSGLGQPDSGKTDFSRFDHGGRTVIYKVRYSREQ